MVTDANIFEAMDLLPHGGMARLFTAGLTPATSGTFLRVFTFVHVRQLEPVSSRLWGNVVGATQLLSDVDEAAHRDSATPLRPPSRPSPTGCEDVGQILSVTVLALLLPPEFRR